MKTPDELIASTHISAPPEIAFPYVTDPELIVRWLGTTATLHPRPGGVFAVDVGDAAARGTYVSVDPPARSSSPGASGSNTLPPGGTTVEVTLTPTDAGTLVTVVHRGLVDTHRVTHEAGWRTFLANLSAAVPSTRQTL